MRLDDEILVNRCLDGDQAAFSFLVNNYKEMVHAYAYHKVADYQEAQDIAQEVFIKAYKNLWQLKSPHKFQSWLYTIVSNECKMWLRKRSEERKRSVYIDDISSDDLDEISIRNHNDSEMHSTVMIAMKTLPDDNRLALSLYYISDMSVKEIANFMGISVNTVKGKLFRARHQLGERVNAMLGKELEKVKLQPGFILMVMDSIKNLPRPSMPKLPIIRLAPISITTLLLAGMFGFGVSFGKGNSPDTPTFDKYKVVLVTNSNDPRPFGMNGNSSKRALIAQNNNISQDKGSINVDKRDTQKVEMNVKEQSTTSKSLENFPKLTWERQCTLCGSITACMEYLKEPFTYDYVMGVSGGAFKLLWYPPNG